MQYGIIFLKITNKNFVVKRNVLPYSYVMNLYLQYQGFNDTH